MPCMNFEPSHTEAVYTLPDGTTVAIYNPALYPFHTQVLSSILAIPQGPFPLTEIPPGEIGLVPLIEDQEVPLEELGSEEVAGDTDRYVQYLMSLDRPMWEETTALVEAVETEGLQENAAEQNEKDEAYVEFILDGEGTEEEGSEGGSDCGNKEARGASDA
ncbi:hypothetical protein BD414DRAFT_509310 [Trametes punicea]|nr:hypothetical protein BD414DRAFT_509310 [Trametes punicea]